MVVPLKSRSQGILAFVADGLQTGLLPALLWKWEAILDINDLYQRQQKSIKGETSFGPRLLQTLFFFSPPLFLRNISNKTTLSSTSWPPPFASRALATSTLPLLCLRMSPARQRFSSPSPKLRMKHLLSSCRKDTDSASSAPLATARRHFRSVKATCPGSGLEGR